MNLPNLLSQQPKKGYRANFKRTINLETESQRKHARKGWIRESVYTL